MMIPRRHAKMAKMVRQPHQRDSDTVWENQVKEALAGVKVQRVLKQLAENYCPHQEYQQTIKTK